MEEIWKPVTDYEGSYEVSTLGKVRSLSRTVMRSNGYPQTLTGRVLRGKSNGHGYMRVNLSGRDFSVHRLVADTFIANPDNKRTVNHKDRVRSNNAKANLEWMTHGENIAHGYTSPQRQRVHLQGEAHGEAKLTEQQVVALRTEYIAGDHVHGQLALSAKYNTSRSNVYEIINRFTWVHI